jgi:transposase/predicted transcriptional regulator
LYSLLDKNLREISVDIRKNGIEIAVESKRQRAKCPYCGKISDKIHSRYLRVLKDLPIQGKKVTIIVNNRKFFCTNQKCTRRTFAETFDFYRPRATKTDRLQETILETSLSQSSISASRYLKKYIAEVSKSTICNLLKKNEKITIDKEAVTAVRIDDFALKKRQRYGTIMADLESGRIIDLIASREPEAVSAWLRGFSNITVASRDGSVNYAAAISEAHPDAIQVSDRFHIIKNLNEKIAGQFHKLFKSRVVIPLTGKTAEREIRIGNGNRVDNIRLVKELRHEGRAIDEIGALTGITNKTIGKYLKMPAKGIPGRYIDSREKEHLETVKRLTERVKAVRELKKQGYGICAITRKTGINRGTVRRYLSPSFVAVNGQYGKHREGKLEPYRDTVLRMKSDGKKYAQIYQAIKALGYTGGDTALRGFIARERRIRNEIKTVYGDTPVELIDKKWLIKLIYHPIGEVKGITGEQLAEVIKAYPQAGILFAIQKTFRDIVLNGNRPRRLYWWIRKAAALDSEEVNSFITGLRKDLPAVKNAIEYRYNNGLAEGSVNKVKVFKRIMYGRCSFDLLRKKVLKYENIIKFN